MALCVTPRKKEERRMKLTNHEWLRAGGWLGLLSIVMGLMGMGLGSAAHAQAISTTTVQGTVYLANGQPGAGTLVLSWPSFTTGSGQLVAADSTTVTIAPDGFVSVNLAPNLGATPAGQYYTAVYYVSDGTTSTQYWVVPAGAQATLGQVQAQLMPAAQAVQTVSKAYVDEAIASLAGGILTVTGATMTGPLTLCCDPTQPLQAADKHYVDENIALEVPLAGGSMTGPLTSVEIGALYQVDQFSGADFGAKLSACLSGLSQTQGGTCDARNFSGTLSMGSNLTISAGNATVQLPCATISTAHQVIVTEGTRNVSLRGCALRGASTASGSQGGTVFLYSGTGAMVQVGDPTYAADTMGFHMDNAVINTTSAASATAQGFLAYRAQELDLESLYLLGNSNQTGMTLDGTGNYTGGTFYDDEFTGFQTAVNAIGHQISNPATTDWLNASTFVRLHIDCPTSGGNPIGGSYGINLQQGDGNTITGGDIEGCATALHLGANAQNNTIVGLRNENSTNQVVADAGSAYNNWMTGGTMFTGALTDNGTRNSFLDTFHRSFNGLNGDWYGSQKDASITNHYRLGIGAGNERGLLNEIQTDYGYRWIDGYSDATAGEQFYQIDDLLNNVYRLSIGQFNNGQSNTNNQTVINSAGTGAVVLNGSNNSGTGGVVIGSGGASETTVATINNAGNAQFNGTLQVGGTSTLAGTPTVKNQADAEIDATLWAGLTASQKESFIYKDWNGNSQWYMVKDASNNWALNSATGGLDSFKAYQSTNSGDTYINASNASGVVRVNYETGSGTGFNIYGGASSSLYASFTGTTAIKFPGLAASSGHNCLQIDNSGYITNTGVACVTGGSNGTVNAGTSGQIAYYSGTGTSISGTNTVSIAAGGTGATSASGALVNLGGVSITGAAFTGPVSAPSVIAGTLAAGTIGALVQADRQAGSAWGEKILNCLAAASAAGSNICDARNLTGSQSLDANLVFTPSNASGMQILLPANLTVNQGTYQVQVQNQVLNFSVVGEVIPSNIAGTNTGAMFTFSGPSTGSGFGWSILDGSTPSVFTQGIVFSHFGIRGTGNNAGGLYLGSPTVNVVLDNLRLSLPTSGSNTMPSLELNSLSTTGFYSQQLAIHDSYFSGGTGVLVTGTGLMEWAQVNVDGLTHISASSNTSPQACVTIVAGEFHMHGTDLEECYYGLHTYVSGVNDIRPDGCCTTYGAYFDGSSAQGSLITSDNTNNLQANGARSNTVMAITDDDVDGMNVTGTGAGTGQVVREYVQDAPMSMILGAGKTTPQQVNLMWADTSTGTTINLFDAYKNSSGNWALKDLINSAVLFSGGGPTANNGTTINSEGTGAIGVQYGAGGGTGGVLFYCGTTIPCGKVDGSGNIYGLSFVGAGTGLTGTAAGLNIGGNAATASTASATPLSGLSGLGTGVATTLALATNGNGGVVTVATVPTAANTYQVVAYKPTGSAVAPVAQNQTALMWSNGFFYNGAGLAFVQNKTTYFGFTLPVALYASHITYRVYTADNTANLYDIGIYSVSGTTATLVSDIGATAGTTFAPSLAVTDIALATPVLLTPGTYIFAETTNCASACAVFYESGAGSTPTIYVNVSGTGTTTGGALPSSITSASSAASNPSESAFMLH